MADESTNLFDISAGFSEVSPRYFSEMCFKGEPFDRSKGPPRPWTSRREPSHHHNSLLPPLPPALTSLCPERGGAGPARRGHTPARAPSPAGCARADPARLRLRPGHSAASARNVWRYQGAAGPPGKAGGPNPTEVAAARAAAMMSNPVHGLPCLPGMSFKDSTVRTSVPNPLPPPPGGLGGLAAARKIASPFSSARVCSLSLQTRPSAPTLFSFLPHPASPSLSHFALRPSLSSFSTPPWRCVGLPAFLLAALLKPLPPLDRSGTYITHTASCTLCGKEFGIGRGGERDVKAHFETISQVQNETGKCPQTSQRWCLFGK